MGGPYLVQLFALLPDRCLSPTDVPTEDDWTGRDVFASFKTLAAANRYAKQCNARNPHFRTRFQVVR